MDTQEWMIFLPPFVMQYCVLHCQQGKNKIKTNAIVELVWGKDHELYEYNQIENKFEKKLKKMYFAINHEQNKYKKCCTLWTTSIDTNYIFRMMPIGMLRMDCTSNFIKWIWNQKQIKIG